MICSILNNMNTKWVGNWKSEWLDMEVVSGITFQLSPHNFYFLFYSSISRIGNVKVIVLHFPFIHPKKKSAFV